MKKTTVLTLALFMSLAFVLAPSPSFYVVKASSGTSTEVQEWPMFRHDSMHTGYSTSVAPNTNNMLWNYRTDGIVESSPAVADGKLYVGSSDNKVYCLNATTGEHLWDYTTGAGVHSSPAVADDRVYVGSSDHNIYCLDMTTGERIWNYTTGSYVDSSPVVVGGRVYVGSYDNKVYCLNATTGEHLWDYTTGDYVASSPAFADGRVYVGSNDGSVYCFNATTGEQIWNYTTGWWVYSSPTIAEDRVYVGSHDNKVYCLNATTGEHIWNCTVAAPVYSSPAVADDRVYVGAGKVYCFNETTGETIWASLIGGPVYSSPAIADGKLYVGCYGERFYCLNVTTGEQIRNYLIGEPVFSSPAIADGTVYFGSRDSRVYAFRDPIYTLTITTTDGGKTDPSSGTYEYYQGTEVTAAATPSAGFDFDHWELDGSLNYSNPITVTMDSNHTLHAAFTYSVTIEAYCYEEETNVAVNIAMDGSPTGYTTPKTFNLTGTHTFTVPDIDSNGHFFKQWNTGETGTTITIVAGGTYTAYYQAKYNLTITATTGGTTDPSPGDYSYWNGTAANVTALPSLGYALDHWDLDGANVGLPNPITVTMDADHALHVVFSGVGTYNLTITTTTGGQTNPAPGMYTHTNGTSVDVTALNDEGYGLDHWELDGGDIGSQNPVTITMDSDHTLNAVFRIVYTLGITTTTGGTTNPSPGTYTYFEGTIVRVTATPAENWNFDHWERDGASNSSNPIDVMMDSDHALHAVFTYSVTIYASCYNEGANVSVVIAMDGFPTGYTTPHTFAGLTETHNFTVPSTDPGGHKFSAWNTFEPTTTITVTKGGTYTAYYMTGVSGVGGFGNPVDKLAILAPYIGLASTLLVVAIGTTVFVKRSKRREKRQ